MYCVIIPIYNHGEYIRQVVQGVVNNNLPCYIVDDGSDENCKKELFDVAQEFKHKSVTLISHTKNEGKGKAVIGGMRQAQLSGFTHALLIDADMQHSLNDIEKFLQMSRSYPTALISGLPVYDDSVPMARKYGRKITTFFCNLETWSTEIKDALCGYRVYPIYKTLEVVDKNKIGMGMDFDPEIMVNLVWSQVKIRYIPTKVIYHNDASSHFKLVRDNARIFMMHSRLLVKMIFKINRLFRK